MYPSITRFLTVTALCTCTGALAGAACTRTTDRVVEPVGAGDASAPSPEASDAGIAPIGPIAHPIEPAEDFRLVRANEFGAGIDRASPRFSSGEPTAPSLGGAGGFGNVSGGGGIGSDRRPVTSATGGSYF